MKFVTISAAALVGSFMILGTSNVSANEDINQRVELRIKSIGYPNRNLDTYTVIFTRSDGASEADSFSDSQPGVGPPQ